LNRHSVHLNEFIEKNNNEAKSKAFAWLSTTVLYNHPSRKSKGHEDLKSIAENVTVEGLRKTERSGARPA
jgi:menaquinone-dependent protoporphyrinogen IX oxidase